MMLRLNRLHSWILRIALTLALASCLSCSSYRNCAMVRGISSRGIQENFALMASELLDVCINPDLADIQIVAINKNDNFIEAAYVDKEEKNDLIRAAYDLHGNILSFTDLRFGWPDHSRATEYGSENAIVQAIRKVDEFVCRGFPGKLYRRNYPPENLTFEHVSKVIAENKRATIVLEYHRRWNGFEVLNDILHVELDLERMRPIGVTIISPYESMDVHHSKKMVKTRISLIQSSQMALDHIVSFYGVRGHEELKLISFKVALECFAISKDERKKMALFIFCYGLKSEYPDYQRVFNIVIQGNGKIRSLNDYEVVHLQDKDYRFVVPW